eukprot:NODE_1595_length_1361_cov_215.319360_g1323_i0.p1 GENE.NODE_1595_length_1361_cov_215.319360_g1323_i0~~NODE_1595_length_1361_cov_215.319360_g1323_i0.p1  ORF type:complete len:401 (+),score=117.65 NODE_1595_length_1361_cov_215.319360_g1323_i0:126-1328(+)
MSGRGKGGPRAHAPNVNASANPIVERIVGTSFDPFSGPRGEFEKTQDFANYFVTYGFLYHQKQMLEDEHRMHAYHSAISQNAETHFKDKVVLDLGTGTGVLAIWAAQAGAKKVYAVEATGMAEHARKLVEANGLSDVIEVLHGSIEDLPVPAEKCDTMVSEWMGYLLLREAMLDSVIVARDRWMKPDACMFPSHARIFFAPVSTNDTNQSVQDLQHEMQGFGGFVERTKRLFKIDLSCLQEPFFKEQRVYLLQSVVWKEIRQDQIVGKPCVALDLDIHTVTLEDIKECTMKVSSLISQPATVTAMAGWFDVEFRGSAANPCRVPSTLSTSPALGFTTHWGHQVFYILPTMQAETGDRLEADIKMTRNAHNHRLLDFVVDYTLQHSDEKPATKTTQKYVLE